MCRKPCVSVRRIHVLTCNVWCWILYWLLNSCSLLFSWTSSSLAACNCCVRRAFCAANSSTSTFFSRSLCRTDVSYTHHHPRKTPKKKRKEEKSVWKFNRESSGTTMEAIRKWNEQWMTWFIIENFRGLLSSEACQKMRRAEIKKRKSKMLQKFDFSSHFFWSLLCSTS